jgi:hypothetical protein
MTRVCHARLRLYKGTVKLSTPKRRRDSKSSWLIKNKAKSIDAGTLVAERETPPVRIFRADGRGYARGPLKG